MAGLLERDRSGPRRLRELLRGPGPVVAPGAYDAMSALLVEQAGFPAVYMTGFGATASLLGRPDIGLLTMTEMTLAARRIVSAAGRPHNRRPVRPLPTVRRGRDRAPAPAPPAPPSPRR
jgi:2-methylisocitrate lyase-like PEP mutase family enzyme